MTNAERPPFFSWTQEAKQWAGAVLAAALLSGLPWLLIELGVLPAVRGTAWAAIILTIVMTALKLTMAPKLSSEGFTFAKQGNDFCQLALSSSITAFAMQSAVPQDVLPGARLLLAALHITLGSPIAMQNIVALMILGVFAATGYLFTAFQVSRIRQNQEAPWMGIRVFGCYLVGAMALSGNALVLISK